MAARQGSGTPRVVIWSASIYLVMLVCTIIVWSIEVIARPQTTLHLYEVMADGLKVGLGALIAVLSQWATRVFGQKHANPQADAADESAKT